MARGTTARFALAVPSAVLPPLRLLAPIASSACAHRVHTAASTSPEPAASTPAAPPAPGPCPLAPTAHDVTAGQPQATWPASRLISRSGTAPRVLLPS